jgi:tetratricopeptide (TPR) repeat protein/DNA-binding CsgD family transcriptional regulator
MLKSMVFGIVNSKSINNFELSIVFTVDLQFNIKRQSTCMRFIRYIFFCLALILWVACGSDKGIKEILSEADSLVQSNPDSAFTLLESVEELDVLSDDVFAEWCLSNANVRDLLRKDPLSINYMSRAFNYFKESGKINEQARMGMFLGHAYTAAQERDKAMNIYLTSLDLADRSQDYNLAGYINTYLADLYKSGEKFIQAKEKYKEATIYFEKAKNLRSRIIAMTNVGLMSFLLNEPSEQVLQYYSLSDTLALELKDSLVLSMVNNRIGLCYRGLNKLELAEKYLLKSIDYAKNGNAPNYFALSDLYVLLGDVEKSRNLLKEISSSENNPNAKAGFIYQQYLLEKGEHNWQKALEYYEESLAYVDSLRSVQSQTNLLEVEKKYTTEKIKNENNLLRLRSQRYFMSLVLIVAVCLLLIVVFQLIMRRKDKKIRLQDQVLHQKDMFLVKQQLELRQMETELSKKEYELLNRRKQMQEHSTILEKQNSALELREHEIEKQEEELRMQEKEVDSLKNDVNLLKLKVLQNSAISKKIVKCAQKVRVGADDGASILTEADWSSLLNEVNAVYKSFTDNLLQAVPELTLEDIRFCCLLLTGLETKELSVVLSINPSSIRQRKMRIRAKAGLTNAQTTLEDYLCNL